ncbi:MAG: anthranilate phosphoribosyltransferase [Dermatophilaceae bacterium]
MAPNQAMAWPDVYARLFNGSDLDRAQSEWAMGQIMSGDASPVQVAGLLVALRAKGETVEEMRGLADQMLAHALRIEVDAPSLDIVGTGGDRAHTVNISTAAALVCAAAGVRVVKHGNRAASSSTGSADVLEALGIDLTLSTERVRALADEVGITFCFAQAFHPSMRHAAVARRELGVPTAFNFLGPLTNPAQPTYAAVGVADARMAPLMAGVFAGRAKDAAVFRGDDGLDELTLATTSTVWWVRRGTVVQHTVDPQLLGLPLAPTEALRGGDPAYNAQMLLDVFAGARSPVRDAIVLNAAVALALVKDSDTEIHADLREGLDRAEACIDSGAVTSLVRRWVAASRTPG